MVAVNCPNCGAGLSAGEAAAQVTCAYCGTVSRVQRRTAYFERPVKLKPDPQKLPVAVQRHSPRWGASVVASLLTIAVAGGGVGFSVYQAKRASARAIQAASPFVGETGTAYSWEGTGGALFADTNGDGSIEIIGRTRYVGSRDAVTISAFDLRTGERLWESDSLGTYTDSYQGPVALAGATIVFADMVGALKFFGVSDGKLQFALSIGERVDTFCQVADDEALYIKRKDKMWVAIDLELRQVADTKEPKGCTVLADDDGQLPGSFSSRNWRLGHGRKALPKVKGMRVAGVLGDKSDVVVGSKEPGTRVPMVARIDGKKTIWTAEVPEGLAAAEGDPLLAAIDDTSVYAVYSRKSDDSTVLTAFDRASGEPRYSSRVPEGFGTSVFEAIAVIDGRIVISAWGRLEVFEASTGTHKFRIGR